MVRDIVREGFVGGIAAIEADLPLTPLSRINESVFRHHVCRFLAGAHPEVNQFIECGRIDLVLQLGHERAFIEFKFYVSPKRFDPYGNATKGFKGRPSPKNLREFRASLDILARLPNKVGLRKFVILAYADPTVASPRATYSALYNAYQHPTDIGLRVVESAGPVSCGDDSLRATLYELDPLST